MLVKYQGSDGWLYDDTTGSAQRHEHQENLRPPEKAKKAPGSPSAARSSGGGPALSTCPNCGFSVTCLRLEGRCTHCGWKETIQVAESAGSAGSSEMSNEAAAGCIGLAAAVVVCPLVGMGVGWGVWGFGGLLVGSALGLGLPVALVIAAMAASNSPKRS
jgi:hypothetical protein